MTRMTYRTNVIEPPMLVEHGAMSRCLRMGEDRVKPDERGLMAPALRRWFRCAGLIAVNRRKNVDHRVGRTRSGGHGGGSIAGSCHRETSAIRALGQHNGNGVHMPKRRSRVPPVTPAAEPEVHGSHMRSIARQEKLKRIVKQHPERDEPKVDAIDEIRYVPKK